MKTINNCIVVLALSALASVGCNAQNSITGTVANYQNGKGLITFSDMISRGDQIVLGNIEKDGIFNIPLDENYLTSIKEKAKNAQKTAPSGWQMKFKTVAATYGCDFDNTNIEYLDDGTEKITFAGSTKKNEIVHKNGEAIVIGMPDLNITDKEGKTGSVLYAVNHPEIAKWLYSYGQGNAVKGYYLQWFFVEDEASAKGECVVPTYTGIGDENYNQVTITNLELQKGWNIVKYSITEIFTNGNGKTTALKTEITTIAELPADLLWTTINVK